MLLHLTTDRCAPFAFVTEHLTNSYSQARVKLHYWVEVVLVLDNDLNIQGYTHGCHQVVQVVTWLDGMAMNSI